MVDTESAKKIIEKDIDKLNTKFARGEIYKKGLIREQEAIIKMCEKEIAKIDTEITNLRKELKPYTLHKKLNDKYIGLRAKYEECLINKDSLQQAITVAIESIDSAKLGYI